MNQNELLNNIASITDETLKEKLLNRVGSESIVKIIEAKNDIYRILDSINSGSYPSWIIQSAEHHAKTFLNFYAHPGNYQDSFVTNMWSTFYFNRIEEPRSDFTYLNIPQIQTWISSDERANSLLMSDLENAAKKVIEQNQSEDQMTIKNMIASLGESKIDADKTIHSLHQASGKVAVERYAAIFSSQAQAYSFERSNVDTAAGEKVPMWLFAIFRGKASLWLLSAFAFCSILILILFNIDDFISLSANTWTPNSVAHLLGRSIIISLNIFIISFCFKQYRINKHLHTLNLHRSNTLKSFEYLTKAPDKLDAASYNAILMKVAESIYNAGHTGYVSSSEQNSDMPSIIDMTKVITSGGKDS